VGALDLGRVGNTGKRELGSEVFDFLLQLLESLGGSSRSSDGRDEVLEELGTSFLLSLERDLDGTVEEVGNLNHLGFLHRSGSESIGSDTDTSGDDSRLVTGDRVLVEGDFSEVADLSTRVKSDGRIRLIGTGGKEKLSSPSRSWNR
jgi:hypothetical protein